MGARRGRALQRSREDAACCRVLGASFVRLTVPDNIYRYLPGTEEAVVKVPDDNLGPLEPTKSYLIPAVADFLRKNVPEDGELVAPLAIGNHATMSWFAEPPRDLASRFGTTSISRT